MTNQGSLAGLGTKSSREVVRVGRVLVIDPAKCRGCCSCMVACATRNEGNGDLKTSRIKVVPFPNEAYFVPMACLQCERPNCVLICPSGALNRNAETGVVERDKDKCIGCKLCLLACPFGNLTFVNGVSAKCELCEGNPICIKVCDWGALSFGEANEIGKGKRVFVANRVYESQKELDSEQK